MKFEQEKEVLRKKMMKKIRSQKPFERRRKSRVIQRKIFSQKEFLGSRCVMLYVSKGTGEVDTGPIIKKALRMKKRVILPVTPVREKTIRPVCLKGLKHGLRKGLYGIFEPKGSGSRKVRISDIDLVIVPGVAFDRQNNRLGRGQGYYDRFLKSLPKDTPKIGLGFRFQLFKKIPAAKHDFSLTKVITN